MKSEVRDLANRYHKLSERDRRSFRLLVGWTKGRSSKGTTLDSMRRPRNGSVRLAILEFLDSQGPSRSLSIATAIGCAQGTVASLASTTNYVKSKSGIYSITTMGILHIAELREKLKK